MRFLRRLHTYLGCFFAPLLLFFVATGWYQTVTLNRHKGFGELGDWKSRLTSVHVDQIYPTAAASGYSPKLFKYLVVCMAIGLILTLVLGVIMAFRFTRNKWTIWASLLTGIILPIVFLWLGQKH